MQSEKQRMIPDPENWVHAYAYDEQGFYVGMVRRQPHPFREGEFLLPRAATVERPNFVEGYRPRWNGSAWELTPATQAEDSKKVMNEAIDEVKSRIYESVAANAKQEVRNEIIREMLEFRNQMFSDFQAMMMNSQASFLDEQAKVLRIYEKQMQEQVLGLRSVVEETTFHLSKSSTEVVGEVMRAKHEALELVAETSIRVEEYQRALIAHVEKPSFWEAMLIKVGLKKVEEPGE